MTGLPLVIFAHIKKVQGGGGVAAPGVAHQAQELVGRKLGDAAPRVLANLQETWRVLHTGTLPHFAVPREPISAYPAERHGSLRSPSEVTSAAPNTAPNTATITAEYRGLAARIDAFFAAVFSRHLAAMHCQAGCSGCCQDGLSVSEIEASNIRDYLAALPDPMRQAIRQRARRDAPPNREAPADPLEREQSLRVSDERQCAIHPVRLLVCRSQACRSCTLPSWCWPRPGGFRRAMTAVVCMPAELCADVPVAEVPILGVAPSLPPARWSDILDAERIDVLLALFNCRYVASPAHNQPQTSPRTRMLRLSAHRLSHWPVEV